MTEPVLSLRDATLTVGGRRLWSGLELDVRPGEFVGVLGANGSGKTSLLRAVLGLLPLSAGKVTIAGQPAHRARHRIGYVRQQHRIDPLTPLRAKDVVRQGLDGHRWGFGRPGRVAWGRVDEALAAVGAAQFADKPLGAMSGGEQQRVRVAQAIVGDPELLLCDEPLLSLDLASQATISALVDQRRREHDTAVVFVTHEINPVLPYVDRVLYLAGGQWAIGSVDEVFTSTVLSGLFGSPIEVIRRGEHILVAGIPATHHDEHDDPDLHHVPEPEPVHQ
ncbi:MAG: ABC transporter ATP-binding protein [Ilumatobacteraceae bacterium]